MCARECACDAVNQRFLRRNFSDVFRVAALGTHVRRRFADDCIFKAHHIRHAVMRYLCLGSECEPCLERVLLR